MAWRCLALAAVLALGVLGVQGVQLQSAAVRLAKAQKEAAHAALFEKDFTVELDMVAAHERNLNLGVELDTDTDFEPVSVAKVRKNGLMQTWNKAHPDNAILVGDQIMKVNDILWHHNSQMFAERIKNQYKAYKDYKAGAKKVLTLAIQRPRRQKETRYQSQREDLHRRMYSREFTVDLPFVQNQTIGWTLNATVDWNAVTIANISHTGLVASWNKDNPDFRIYPGDEIIMANSVNWHHNAKVFKNRIDTMLRRTLTEPNKKVAITLRIQRPRSVVEALEAKTFQKMFDVTLPTIDTKQIGWTLQTNTSDPINITGISDGSFLSLWNKRVPEQSLAVGDRILKANAVSWHNDKVNFANNLLKLVSTRHNTTLRVQRLAQFNYAKGWTVEIPARANQLLGLQLNASDDELPVTINMVRRLSATSLFNEDNPDDAVTPGDQIFKVNNVLWRGNSREFAQNLEQQFAKSKRTGVMRLWVQRPEGVQTKDDSSLDYLEFTTELNVSSPEAMGWELNATGVGPATISKLTDHGSIDSWNANNPLKEIQVGDQLIQVEDNIWHNNTEVFMKHLGHQLADAAGSKGKGSVMALFHRPYEANTDDEAEGKDEELGGDVMGAEE